MPHKPIRANTMTDAGVTPRPHLRPAQRVRTIVQTRRPADHHQPALSNHITHHQADDQTGDLSPAWLDALAADFQDSARRRRVQSYPASTLTG